MQKKNFLNQIDVIDSDEYLRLCIPKRSKSITQLLFLLILFIISFFINIDKCKKNFVLIPNILLPSFLYFNNSKLFSFK